MLHDSTGPRRAILLGILFEGGLGVLACVVGWLIGTEPWKQLAWNARDVGLGTAGVIPLLVLFAVATRSRAAPLVRIRNFLDEVFLPLFEHSTVAELALLSALAGIGEEFLFRGVLQTALGESFGQTAGLLIASIAFGIAHWITPTYAVAAGVIGLYLGWVAIATGNLAVPIVTHALYDFVALVYLLRWHGPRLARGGSSEGRDEKGSGNGV